MGYGVSVYMSCSRGLKASESLLWTWSPIIRKTSPGDDHTVSKASKLQPQTGEGKSLGNKSRLSQGPLSIRLLVVVKDLRSNRYQRTWKHILVEESLSQTW